VDNGFCGADEARDVNVIDELAQMTLEGAEDCDMVVRLSIAQKVQ
jgi:hypothetical protein